MKAHSNAPQTQRRPKDMAGDDFDILDQFIGATNVPAQKKEAIIRTERIA